MCPQTPSLSPEYSHKAGLQAVITRMPLRIRPVTQRRPRRARYNGPDHTWASELNEAAPREGVVACLRRNRWTNGDKTTGRLTLRPIHHRTKTCDNVIQSCDLVQHGGPRVIRPIVTGPAWPLRITGLICKGIPVITVCNPALWEYSGDNLGV